MYSTQDLEKAIENKDFWDNKFANDSSNNPNKYFSQRRDAAVKVRVITSYLKEVGQIDKSEIEKLNDLLDSLYPDSKSKTIVEYQGRRFQIRYYPLVKSRSRKNVKEWGHSWEEL